MRYPKTMLQVTPILFLLTIASLNILLVNSSQVELEEMSENNSSEDSVKRPRSINLNDPISYLLYDHSDDTWVRLPNSDNVPRDLWNFRGTIKIVLHGFNGRSNRDPMKVMESMLIVGREYAKKNSSLNIIAVDWTPLATRPIHKYAEAAKNTHEAGVAVAKYLMSLRSKKAFFYWRKIHMIGFSLGAHVAGVAGEEIQKLTGGRKIGRITGLDPAGPEFDKEDQKMISNATGILDKSDARYVDIIHCNMGPPGSNLIRAALAGQFGSTLQAGHADFYPNGGERQRFQCDEFQDRTAACSHNMCSLFFALSITMELPACPCKSWSYYVASLCSCWTGDDGKAEYMGDLSNRRGTARGKYFLIVDNKINVKYFLN